MTHCLTPTTPTTPRRLLRALMTAFLWICLGILWASPGFAQTGPTEDTPESEPPAEEIAEIVEPADEPAEDPETVEESEAPPAEPEIVEPPPGNNLLIRAIEFRGNRRITDDAIFYVMRLRPGMPYSPGAVQEDLRRIGEMGVWASPPEFSGEAVEGGVKMLIFLEENPTFQTAQVVFDKGPGLFTTGELERAFIHNPTLPFTAGQIISAEGMKAGIAALEKVYRDAGYAAAAVTQTEILSEGAQAGTIILHINEGVIAEIRLVGNTKTNEYVIRREILVQVGEVLDASEIRTTLRRLSNLQLFEQVSPGVEFTETQEIILVLTFVESRTGQLGFGVGYSSQDGILGTLSYAERNFQGKGQSIRAGFQIGGPDPEGSLSYFIPWIAGQGSSLGLELFRQSFTDTERDPEDPDRYASYDTRRTGGEVKLIYPMSRNVDATVGLKMLNGEITLNPDSTADLTDISEFAQRGLLDGTSNSLTLGLARDTRDFALDATNGSVTSITANYFGGPLGGDFDAIKITGEFKRFWRLTAEAPLSLTAEPEERPHVFAARLLAGGTIGNLSLLDRFELGGTNSIRGVEFASQTGDKSVLANLEYRFPIINDLSGVAFVDAGTASQPGESLDFGNLLTSIGLGIRYRIPFLGVAPLRVDYGFDLEGGDSQVVLGFGQLF